MSSQPCVWIGFTHSRAAAPEARDDRRECKALSAQDRKSNIILAVCIELTTSTKQGHTSSRSVRRFLHKPVASAVTKAGRSAKSRADPATFNGPAIQFNGFTPALDSNQLNPGARNFRREPLSMLRFGASIWPTSVSKDFSMQPA